MKNVHVVRALLLLVWLVGTSVPGVGVDAPDNPATRADPQSPGWWMQRHQQKLSDAAGGDVDLVVLGDSITQNYERPEYRSIWQRFYAPRKALNLGFSGDTTANVLWRLQHGEVDHLHPQVVMVMIGTNNSGIYHVWSAAQTQEGMDAVVAELHERLPLTHLVLLGILPSTISDWKMSVDTAVNRYLEDRYRGSSYVTFLDVGYVFMKDGAVDTTLFSDPQAQPPRPALHPSSVGQERMARAIEPTLSVWLP